MSHFNRCCPDCQLRYNQGPKTGYMDLQLCKDCDKKKQARIAARAKLKLFKSDPITRGHPYVDPKDKDPLH